MENKVVVLFALLFIALVVILFSFYQYFSSQTADITEEELVDTEKIVYPAITPEEVTETFHKWYLGARNTIPSDVYLESEILTESFKTRLQNLIRESEELPYDPLLCTSDKPDELLVRPARIIDDRADVVVNSRLGGEEISFIVELLLSGDSWKISNVVCFVKG